MLRAVHTILYYTILYYTIPYHTILYYTIRAAHTWQPRNWPHLSVRLGQMPEGDTRESCFRENARGGSMTGGCAKTFVAHRLLSSRSQNLPFETPCSSTISQTTPDVKLSSPQRLTGWADCDGGSWSANGLRGFKGVPSKEV